MAEKSHFDRLVEDHGPEYGWVSELIKRDIPAFQEEQHPKDFQNMILQLYSSNTDQPYQRFEIDPKSTVDERWGGALAEPDVRFVVIHHPEEPANLNPHLLEAILNVFDINPAIFPLHFGRLNYYNTVIPSSAHKRNAYDTLLSHEKAGILYVYTHHGLYLHAVAGKQRSTSSKGPGVSPAVQGSDLPPVIVVFIPISDQDERLDYGMSLGGRAPELTLRICSGESCQNPLEMLRPLVEQLVRGHKYGLEDLLFMTSEVDGTNPSDLRGDDRRSLLGWLSENAWKIRYRCEEYSHTCSSFKDFLSYCNNSRGLDTSPLLHLAPEFEEIKKDNLALSAQMAGATQQILAMVSIDESQKSIQSAESVRRLTIVAFIFIPLNFATSFFGMNLKQLGTSSLNIGWFFLLAVLVSLITYSIAFLLFRIEKLSRILAHVVKVALHGGRVSGSKATTGTRFPFKRVKTEDIIAERQEMTDRSTSVKF